MTVEEATRRFRAGEMLILVDDENRENEGDLALAAEHVTADAINFMITHGRGLVCVPITEARACALGLSPMCPKSCAQQAARFAVSVDARTGVATGISAHDRARTIRLLVGEATRPGDLLSPGHVFPLIARDGGVLQRAGHTEAAADLARLAGLRPAAVLCEILNEDGTMARLPDLEPFSETHGLPIVRIANLIEHRKRIEGRG